MLSPSRLNILSFRSLLFCLAVFGMSTCCSPADAQCVNCGVTVQQARQCSVAGCTHFSQTVPSGFSGGYSEVYSQSGIAVGSYYAAPSANVRRGPVGAFTMQTVVADFSPARSNLGTQQSAAGASFVSRTWFGRRR